MQNLTYSQLRKIIDEMPLMRQNDNVSVYLEGQDEYLPVKSAKKTVGSDVLDNGHLVLAIDF